MCLKRRGDVFSKKSLSALKRSVYYLNLILFCLITISDYQYRFLCLYGILYIILLLQNKPIRMDTEKKLQHKKIMKSGLILFEVKNQYDHSHNK